MDVGVWLRSLGLGQYEATFWDNEIDGAVLPKLTVDDLKDLGVAVVGHRRKIMSAIEELNAVARTDVAEALPTQAALQASASSGGHDPVLRSRRLDESSREPRRRGLAQPRQRLSRRGIEGGDWAWRACFEAARRRAHGPLRLSQAHRRIDAERAVSAALAIQRALADLNAQERGLRRTGAEGPDRDRDSARSSSRRTAKCSAKRRMSLRAFEAAAAPSTVLITSTVQRQIAGVFVAEDKGAHELKGVSAASSRSSASFARKRRGPKGRRAVAHAVRRPRRGASPPQAAAGHGRSKARVSSS